jgi:hypothetical protein
MALAKQNSQIKFLRQWWSGTVVVASGRRRLIAAEERIGVTPFVPLVPLNEGVKVYHPDGHELVPSGKFFISVGTSGPHVLVDTKEF